MRRLRPNYARPDSPGNGPLEVRFGASSDYYSRRPVRDGLRSGGQVPQMARQQAAPSGSSVAGRDCGRSRHRGGQVGVAYPRKKCTGSSPSRGPRPVEGVGISDTGGHVRVTAESIKTDRMMLRSRRSKAISKSPKAFLIVARKIENLSRDEPIQYSGWDASAVPADQAATLVTIREGCSGHSTVAKRS